MAKSDGVSYDLTSVEETDGGMEALPRGDYACELDETVYSESSNGNHMITCRWEVIDGDFANRKLWDRIVLTEKGLPMLKKKLRVIMEANGLEAEMKKLFKKLTVDAFVALAEDGDLIGAQAELTVAVRNYEGEKRNDVKRLSELEPMEEGDDDFMDDDDAPADDDGPEEDDTAAEEEKKPARGRRRAA